MKELLEHMEWYCKVLLVFGFTSAKYDLSPIKSYLLTILAKEQDIKSTVIKKANRFVSFEIVGIQLMDILNILGETTSLDSFLKAYKTSKTRRFSPNERFDNPDKIRSPYDVFHNKLCSFNTFEAEYRDYFNFLKKGLTTDQAVINLKLSKPSTNGIENYHYLQQIWKQQQMS